MPLVVSTSPSVGKLALSKDGNAAFSGAMPSPPVHHGRVTRPEANMLLGIKEENEALDPHMAYEDYDMDEGVAAAPDEVDELSMNSIASSSAEIPLDKRGHVSAGDFHILSVVGKGTFGKVFLVSKVNGADKGTHYAMKVLRKASLKVADRHRTRKERDILTEVRHPFIVEMHYAFQTEGKVYLILEFVCGGDLFTRLRLHVMFTEEDACFYLSEILLAIGHLHSIGILYRDLKPENVLLDREGHVKLTDFGLSKVAEEDEATEDEASKTYSFVGTLEYMAPEVVTKSGHNRAADWWSFGVLMYEMLTGRLPFKDATSRRHLMELILKAKLPMPQFLSRNAKDLLKKLFKRIPSHRLGFGRNGTKAIQAEVFFAGIDWDALLKRKIKPPFIPLMAPSSESGEQLNKYFDREFTTMAALDSPTSTPLPASEGEMFRGFSFVDPSALDNAKAKHQRRLSQEFITAMDALQMSGDALDTTSREPSDSLNEPGTPNSDTQESPFVPSMPLPTKPARRVSAPLDPLAGYPAPFVLPETNRAPITDDYQLEETIAEGSFSIVRRAVHRETRLPVAVKMLIKSLHDPHREADILRRCSDQENIITLDAIYEDDKYLYLVTELCSGGELFEHIVSHGRLPESEAVDIMRALFGVVNYLHRHNIVHRDLKPENILFKDASHSASSLRIADFGFARQLLSTEGLIMTPCYTSNYCAPEVLTQQGYAESVDLWSLGALLYTMLAGRPPFLIPASEKDSQAILKRIESNTPTFDGATWSSVSSECISLIKSLLEPDVEKRLTAEQALQHPWLASTRSTPAPAAATTTATTVIDDLSSNNSEERKRDIANSIKACLDSARDSVRGTPSLKPLNASKLFLRRKHLPNVNE